MPNPLLHNTGRRIWPGRYGYSHTNGSSSRLYIASSKKLIQPNRDNWEAKRCKRLHQHVDKVQSLRCMVFLVGRLESNTRSSLSWQDAIRKKKRDFNNNIKNKHTTGIYNTYELDGYDQTHHHKQKKLVLLYPPPPRWDGFPSRFVSSLWSLFFSQSSLTSP